MDMNEQFSRLPPHNLDAERCLLASLMLSGDDAVMYAQVGELVRAEDFFQADHRVIYDALTDMRRRRRPIDAVLFCEHLVAKGVFEEIGGHGYIGEILATVPSAAHGVYYAKIVHTAAKKRGAITAANAVIDAMYAPADDEEATDLIGRAARAMSQLATTGRAQRVHRLGDVAAEILSAHADGVKPKLIPTGLATLDRLIGGLPIQQHTVIGAKQGVGKSTLLKQLALNMSARVPIGIISVEESRNKIGENALANRAEVVNARIAHGTGTAQDWARVAAAAADLADCPIHIVDSASKLSDILAMAEVLAVQHGCKVIGVDHLHIVSGEMARHHNRENEIAHISKSLKTAWKQLDVAGVSCAQLNRGGGDHERPTMGSLRDSGSLAQDGDVILLCYREDWNRKQRGEPAENFDNTIEVNVAKNKSGPCGTVILAMDEAYQRITDRVDPAVQAALETFGVPEHQEAY